MLLIEDNIPFNNECDIDEEYDEELLEELDDKCEKILETVRQYINPFNNVFSTKYIPYDNINISVAQCYLEYLYAVHNLMDSDSPIKEIEVVIRVLELLIESVDFNRMKHQIQQDSAISSTTNFDSHQVMSNIYSQMFKDIFRYQVTFK